MSCTTWADEGAKADPAAGEARVDVEMEQKQEELGEGVEREVSRSHRWPEAGGQACFGEAC